MVSKKSKIIFILFLLFLIGKNRRGIGTKGGYFLFCNTPLMQVKRRGEHSAKLLTFIKLPFVIKIFVLSIFEWPFYTGFTVIFFF